MIFTSFLLSKNSIYKIELQKYKQYPALDIYVKIPTNDKKIEIINYENLATHSDDVTQAYFFVGKGNKEKNIHRKGENDVITTYDETLIRSTQDRSN